MVARVLMVLAVFVVIYGCGRTSPPPEGAEKKGDAGQAETAKSSGAGQEGNIPISGVVGETVETPQFDYRILDVYSTDNYYYLENPSVPTEQEAFSQAGEFVVLTYSVTNTNPETVTANLGARLFVKAGNEVEVYEETDQVSHPYSGAIVGGPELGPRQMLLGQFIFDVPTDVEPETVAVLYEDETEEARGEAGAVDLTEEDPQGPRPEEVLALQYEYGNMNAWEQAYELFAQESKNEVSQEDYVGTWEEEPPQSLTQYAFPSVEVKGDHATIERVYTAATQDGEVQDKATQEAVLEDEGWNIVMREDQVKFFLAGGETTSVSGSASASGNASASASAIPEPDKECSVGEPCDIGTGNDLTIEKVETTDVLTSEFSSPKQGDFVVVDYSYTYNGNQAVTMDDYPWIVQDDEERTYRYDFDSTNEYVSDPIAGVYAEFQPGIPQEGRVIFQVAPDSENLSLLITDPVLPQDAEVANVELSETSATGTGDGSEAEVVGAAEEYYEAVDREDWAYTYDSLDSQTRSMFTEEEWAQKNQWFADNEGLMLSSMDVQVNESASDGEVGVTVYRTFENGTSITRDTIFVMEDGSWKHRFTEEESAIFMPGTPYEEFVAAQQ